MTVYTKTVYVRNDKTYDSAGKAEDSIREDIEKALGIKNEIGPKLRLQLMENIERNRDFLISALEDFAEISRIVSGKDDDDVYGFNTGDT